MRRLALALVCLAMPAAAANEEVVIGLSQDEVAITTDFAGSEILVFGAVKHEGPVQVSPPLQVIVTVAGPPAPVTVRRKHRVAGIWVNTESVGFNRAPTYYAVASTGPLDVVLGEAADERYDISLARAIAARADVGAEPVPARFLDALIRLRRRGGDYRIAEGAMTLIDQTLFDTSVALPADLTEGTYTVRVFLLRSGEVVEHFGTAIAVSRVGLERWLFDLAHQRPALYGLLSLAIALGAGWGASAAFRSRRAG